MTAALSADPARRGRVLLRVSPGAPGLSPARVHQITAGADLDGPMPPWASCGLARPGRLRRGDDAELDGRDLICERLVDEAGWPRQCADRPTHLHTGEYPPAVNLRPEGNHRCLALVMAGLPRVARSCSGSPPMPVSWPAPAAWPTLGRAAALPGRQAGRRCRVTELNLEFREFCRRNKLPRSERSSNPFAAERHRHGKTGIPSYEAYNPYRHRQRGPYA